MNEINYNDEMDIFLSKPENYKSALELIDNIVRIDKKLADEFWLEVTQRLKSKIKKLMEIEVITKYDQDSNSDWFEIYKKDWDFYFISTDNEDVGIRIIDKPEKDMVVFKAIIEATIEEKKEQLGSFKSLKWPCWKTFSNYRFQTKQEKLKILPDVRDTVIEGCVNTLFVYIGNLIEACEVLNKKINEIQNRE